MRNAAFILIAVIQSFYCIFSDSGNNEFNQIINFVWFLGYYLFVLLICLDALKDTFIFSIRCIIAGLIGYSAMMILCNFSDMFIDTGFLKSPVIAYSIAFVIFICFLVAFIIQKKHDRRAKNKH